MLDPFDLLSNTQIATLHLPLRRCHQSNRRPRRNQNLLRLIRDLHHYHGYRRSISDCCAFRRNSRVLHHITSHLIHHTTMLKHAPHNRVTRRESVLCIARRTIPHSLYVFTPFCPRPSQRFSNNSARPTTYYLVMCATTACLIAVPKRRWQSIKRNSTKKMTRRICRQTWTVRCV